MPNETTLSQQNIEEAKSAVTTYMATCEGLFNRLQTIMNNLVPQDFSGQAANGYQAFFQQITPTLTANIFHPGTSLPYKIQTMLDMTQDALLLQADPQLGQQNSQAVGGS